MSLPDPFIKDSFTKAGVWKYANSDASLTPGQVVFIQAMCRTGFRSSHLAAALGLSVKTIDCYRDQIKGRWFSGRPVTDIMLFKEAVKRGYYEFPESQDLNALQLGKALREQEGQS